MNDGRCEVEIRIRTSPETLWEAITNPDQTRQYWHHALNHSTWQPGAPWTSESESGEVYIDGEIIEADAPMRLVHTFRFTTGSAVDEPPSTVAWDIRVAGDECRLRLTHTNLDRDTLESVTGTNGWDVILSGLKTLLETGVPVEVGAAGAM